MTDLFSSPFFTWFWQCTHWAELKTDNTKEEIEKENRQEGERERQLRDGSTVKPPSWHLNKCQIQGVRWMETSRDQIGAVCRFRFVTRSGRQPIGLQCTCLDRLRFDSCSPFGRCLSLPSPSISSKKIKENCCTPKNKNKNSYAFCHSVPSHFLKRLSKSGLWRG